MNKRTKKKRLHNPTKRELEILVVQQLTKIKRLNKENIQLPKLRKEMRKAKNEINTLRQRNENLIMKLRKK